ncbi:MAG TPA: MFS transporter [Anaerolineales bacterium]|nr:MFS transporter [Anaerolineales bacterium]HRQ92067.1 MFS transporter [Anaerolineales bacterium]
MQPSQIVSPRWQRPFFQMWIGQALSLLGSQLVQFALVWYLTRETGSATVLATATLVALLPNILLGPLAGSIVDRGERKRIMILADGAIALATVVLALLFATGAVQIWHIYVLMAVRSLGGSFHSPAFSASTSLMVPKEHLPRIQGVNQVLNGGLSVVAAPLGALLLEFLPTQGLLAIDVVTAAIAIMLVLPLAIPQPAKAADGATGRQGFWAAFREGFSYVWSWPGLMMLLVMSMLINLLFSPAISLFPLLVTKHFQQGAAEFGWLQGAWGLGIVLGGALLGVWGGFKRRIYTSQLGLLGLGIALTLLGLLPPSGFTLGVAFVLMAGMMLPLSNGSFWAVMQATVDPARQGRVFSLVISLASAMAPLGLLLAGPLVDSYGVPLWYQVAGVLSALMGLFGFLIPAVRDLEKGRPQPAVPTKA